MSQCDKMVGLNSADVPEVLAILLSDCCARVTIVQCLQESFKPATSLSHELGQLTGADRAVFRDYYRITISRYL
jgi:hypothetical protein